jgi:hypothetical protein
MRATFLTWQRTARLILAATLLFATVANLVPKTEAAPSLVQTNSTNTGSNSISLSFSSASAGNLLVVICAMNTAATITGPSGYSTAINESGDPAQGIFYKAAAGGETSASCSYSVNSTAVIHVFEYSGLHAYSPLDATNAGGSTGTTGTASTGNVTTSHASDVLVAAVISSSSGSNPNTWTNSFTNRNSSTVGGNPSKRAAYGSSDRTVSTTGTYSTTAPVGSGSTWRGQIAAFKALAASPSLTFDFVDSGGSSVSSPTASLGSISPTFICQTVTGTLGSSSQRFRVNNTTDNPAWTLTMAATGGPTATWSAPTSPPHSYKFNDAAGSGCTNGQLTVNASAGTLTAQANCSTSGVSKGSSTAFVSGTVDTVTILNAATPADIDCYWELISVGLSQKVPAGQLGGNYTLNMTVTITAN